MSATDVVVPLTGQAISLDAPTDEIADAYREIQNIETALRVARAPLRDELLKRMDHELARSAEVNGLYLECDAPNQIEYNADELAEVLARLIADGKISATAASQAVATEEVKKAKKRGIDKLIAAPTLTDEDLDAIRACAHPTTKPRRLTVKKADDR